MKPEVYSSRSSAFAERAQALFDSDSQAHLFYAALEIRFGVEARLQAYTEAAKSTHSSLRAGWEIPKLAKGIEKAFGSSAKKVAELVYHRRSTGEVFAVLRFTPVPNSLTKLAQRLGDYLHFREGRLPYSDAWWQEFKTQVATGCKLLKLSASGELLGPPLWKPDTGEVQLKLELQEHDARLQLFDDMASTREVHDIEVRYISFEDLL